MKLFSLGIENDRVDTNVEDMTVDDILDSMELAEIESTMAEVESMDFSLETGYAALESMESLVDVQEKMVESGNITETDLTLMKISLESMLDVLGYDQKDIITGSLESTDDPAMAVVASMEKEKNILERAWEAIKAFITQMVQMLSDTITRITMMLRNLKKSYAAVRTKANEIEADSEAKDFDKDTQEKIASYFVAMLSLLNKKEIDSTLSNQAYKFYTDRFKTAKDLVQTVKTMERETDSLQNILRADDVDKLKSYAAIEALDEKYTEISAYGNKIRKLAVDSIDLSEKLSGDIAKSFKDVKFYTVKVDTETVEDVDPDTITVKPADIDVIKNDSVFYKLVDMIEKSEREANIVSNASKKFLDKVKAVTKTEAQMGNELGKAASKLAKMKLKALSDMFGASLKAMSYIRLDAFKTASYILKYYNESLKQYSDK